jgi:hypothetical protein
MKFTTSALISAIAIAQLAVVGNASPVSKVGDDHSQHHLEKRGVGTKMLAGMGVGVGTGLGVKAVSSLINKAKKRRQTRAISQYGYIPLSP